MKKLVFFLGLVALMASSTCVIAQSGIKYIIIYAQGVDTLVQNAGDKIGSNSLVFYEKQDEFYRGDPMDNGIIACSSHGYKFWLKNVQMEEDTLAGFIKIKSAIVVADPNDLVAAVIQPTSGDANSPLTPDIPLRYKLLIGFLIALALGTCFWLWFRKKQRKPSL
jgi:hypothetical protein